MNRKNKALLFCLDESRSFTEDIKKRFSDTSKYRVLSFSSRQDFLSGLAAEKAGGCCKVAVIVINEIKEDGYSIERFTREVHKISADMGMILVFSPEKDEEIRKAVKFNIDAYIPKNSNSILRLHNVVKKLISKHNLEIYHKRRNLSLWVLLVFVLISAIIILVTFL
ncbi:MAG: hypothetical protein Q8868_10445 [Bacteroidota bacterium]|nr:hypothetical protein [Bacteroidota bacterium]